MTDRELLEAAAKAAGIDLGWWAEELHAFWMGQTGDAVWNPLADDGDALRLAVRLRIAVDPWGVGAAAVAIVNNRAATAEPHYGDDPGRATRRAIVRAAAEIARAMP
jgi:hypothetical protein